MDQDNKYMSTYSLEQEQILAKRCSVRRVAAFDCASVLMLLQRFFIFIFKPILPLYCVLTVTTGYFFSHYFGVRYVVLDKCVLF